MNATHVYLVLAHEDQQQVCRLVRRILADSNNAIVFLHYDGLWNQCSMQETSRFRLVPRFPHPILWGHFSIPDAILHSMCHIIENYADFSWLTLLSGQDYPLQKVSSYESFLSQSSYDGFIDHPVSANRAKTHDSDDPIVRRIREWYGYKYTSKRLNRIARHLVWRLEFLNNYQDFFKIKASRQIGSLGFRRKCKLFDTMDVYHGQLWFTLRAKVVHYLAQLYKDKDPRIEYFRTTWIPDESVFQTLILENKSFNISGDNLRHIDQPYGKPHPKILRQTDFHELRSSKKWFARKFKLTVDEEILDSLDAQLNDGTV